MGTSHHFAGRSHREPTRPTADPRLAPRYTAADVARMLDMPAATVRSWFVGAGATFKPVLQRASGKTRLLSFENLVEVHVLRALRMSGVRMPKVREAIRKLVKDYGPHPLAVARFKTDGKDVFVEHLGKLLNLNQQSQAVIREALDVYLSRVTYEAGRAVTLFPMRGPRDDASAPSPVMVNPELGFGRPLLAGTRVPLAELVNRQKAGEDVKSIAADFEIEPARVREALEWWRSGGRVGGPAA